MTNGIVAVLFASALALGVCSERVTARVGTGSVAPERTFTIEGQVASPGTYEFKEGLTVPQAIAEAGGLIRVFQAFDLATRSSQTT